MFNGRKMADLFPFCLLLLLIIYEFYKRIVPILVGFDVNVLIFIALLPFFVLFFKTGLFRGHRIEKYPGLDEVLYTRDKILIQVKDERFLVKALEIRSLENNDIEGKFSQIAEILAHMGINSSLTMLCSPKKSEKHLIDLTAGENKDQRREIFQNRVILLWVEEKDVGGLKMAKSMLDRAEDTIKARLGDYWEVIPLKGSHLKSFSNSLLFRFQLALSRINLKEQASEDLVNSLYLELGRKSNGSVVKLSLKDLCHHIAILGRTGSGKTTTSKFLISKIWEIGVPALIFDYENEYRDLVLMLGGVVLSPTLSDALVSINVLEDLESSNDAVLDEIVEQFTIILGLTPPQTYLLLKGLIRLREQAMRKRSPTLVDLYEEIASLAVSGQAEQESKKALLRRIYPLIRGEARQILCKEHLPPMEDIMNGLVSVELRDIATQYVREIFTFTLLRRIYHYNKEKGRTRGIRHITVLEEADRVLPKLKDLSGLTIGDRMVSELRKYGEGFIVISQSPSSLSPHVIRNASTKIIHALGSTQDISFIHSLLGPSGKAIGEIAHQIHHLRTGECFVVLRNSPELSRIRIEPEYQPPELEDEEITYLFSLAPSFYCKWRKEVLRSKVL
ncbi:MAG: hypothetical protein DRN92_06070 [Thermoproteota archaeon]|nr:MAG: hypothetical protein DRN92_06070 [Candidatus Korarchaeota archaeon]